MLPLAGFGFLLPPVLLHQDVLAKSDVFAIVPISAALAEALAWFTDLFVVADRERRDAEVRFKMLVERSPAAIYTGIVKDGTFQFDFLSPQLEGILGHRATEWIGSPGGWRAAMHSDDRDAVTELDYYCNRTGEPFRMEYRLQTAGGGWVWVRDEAVRADETIGEGSRWLGVMTDITATKEVQEALENSERRYRVLFQSAPDP